MSLKLRVKKAEKEVVPRQKTKLWVVHPEDKEEEVEEKIKAITEGKTRHKDGTFYRPGDPIFIISRHFLPKLEDKKRDLRATSPKKEDVKIRKRIKALKKKKAELEKRLKEKRQ